MKKFLKWSFTKIDGTRLTKGEIVVNIAIFAIAIIAVVVLR